MVELTASRVAMNRFCASAIWVGVTGTEMIPHHTRLHLNRL